MSKCRIGTTIIDALKLCYMVNVEDLSRLMELDYGHWKSPVRVTPEAQCR